MKRLLLIFGLLVAASPVLAVEKDLKPDAFSVERLYFGGGPSLNKLSGWDDGVGWQFFAGYDIGMEFAKMHLLVEAGYWNSGEFERTIFGVKFKDELRGPWGSAVVRYQPIPHLDLLGRVGYSAGDDRGPMFGAGAGYWLTKHFAVRGEAVIRDDTDSIQVNFIYSP